MVRSITMVLALGMIGLMMVSIVPLAMAERQQGPGNDRNGNGPQKEVPVERKNGLVLRVDQDKDGNISLREFYKFVNGRLDNDTLKRIFNATDKDANGILSYREFVQAINMMLKLKAQETRKNPDRDGDGYISAREFYAFTKGKLDNQTIRRIFNAADRDDDGKLSKREFMVAVRLMARAKANQNYVGFPDTDGDGNLSLREFHRFINGRLDNTTINRLFNASDRDGSGNLSRREFVYALGLIHKKIANDNIEETEEGADPPVRERVKRNCNNYNAGNGKNLRQRILQMLRIGRN